MSYIFGKLIIFFIAILFPIYGCIEPLTTTATISGIVLSTGFAGWKIINCAFYECCDKTWIKYDMYKLEKEMNDNLFGQHLVNNIVQKSLKAHTERENPKKALVMSFHGDTGSGKNHVSKMIMQHLFKEGSKSKYAHLYIGTQHFPHKTEVQKYRDTLRKEIEEKTKLCGRSLFIFDEVDKIPPGVLDALTPYLDYHDMIDSVDYRKNVFIFLSNAGAKNIARIALQFWSDGKDRKEITLKDMEHLITKGAFNEEGFAQ